MIRAENKDRALVADILTRSFDQNKSVNYIIRQGKRRSERIRMLMEYSFDICCQYGDVFLSEDKKACALLVFPDKKRTSFKSVVSDIQLATACIGLSNIKKALDREAKIKKNHPKEPMYYLWFIGVDPEYQNKGIGSSLLQGIRLFIRQPYPIIYFILIIPRRLLEIGIIITLRNIQLGLRHRP